MNPKNIKMLEKKTSKKIVMKSENAGGKPQNNFSKDWKQIRVN